MYCCGLSSVLLLSLELNHTKSLLMVSSHNWIFGDDYILCNYPVCGKYTFFSFLISALVTPLKFIQVWLCLLVFFSPSGFTFIVQKVSSFVLCDKLVQLKNWRKIYMVQPQIHCQQRKDWPSLTKFLLHIMKPGAAFVVTWCGKLLHNVIVLFLLEVRST